MKLEKWSFRLTGVSPLLTANPSGMEPVSDGIKTKKKIPTPDEQAQSSVYKIDGRYSFPAIAVRSAVLSACTGKKVGKSSAKSIVAASIVHAQEWCTICDKNGKPVKNFAVDVRRVVNHATGGAMLRGRAKFDEWTAEITFEVDVDMLPSKEQLVELLNEAGVKIGVGDYRPACMGWFGKFRAEAVK